MHYRHLFHAGNFGDVFKHTLLIGLIEAMARKDKPWLYLDTHAGAGAYELRSTNAARTGEWRDGIGRLVGKDAAAPALVAGLLKAVGWTAAGASHSRRYPGSPLLVERAGGLGARIVCCESVVEVAEQLRAHVPKAQVHLRDGYESHSLLPPPEKRGLILIDPPFEARNEFEQMGDFLREAVGRFSNGIYAAWYPLKNRHEAERFLRRMQRDLGRPQLVAEMDTGAEGQGQMRATGLLVVNPPFGFEAQARESLGWLTPLLAQGAQAHWNLHAAG